MRTAEQMLEELENWPEWEPYIESIIHVLLPYRMGLSRSNAISAVYARRASRNIDLPDTFEQTIQSAFNSRCATSTTHDLHNPNVVALFYSEHEGKKAIWKVADVAAKAWLRKKNGRL